MAKWVAQPGSEPIEGTALLTEYVMSYQPGGWAIGSDTNLIEFSQAETPWKTAGSKLYPRCAIAR